MIEKGILFNAEMVRKILAREKTQTRRMVKPQPFDTDGLFHGPEYYEPACYTKNGDMYPGKEIYGIYDDLGEWGCKSPYVPGDQLYVRETWREADNLVDGYTRDLPYYVQFLDGKVYYISTHPSTRKEKIVLFGKDYNTSKTLGRWRPSIHMPKWAARIWLNVVDISVQKLPAISEEDAIAEGFSCKEEFLKCWDSIYHNVNDWPLVWVVEFEIDKVIGENDG